MKREEGRGRIEKMKVRQLHEKPYPSTRQVLYLDEGW